MLYYFTKAALKVVVGSEQNWRKQMQETVQKSVCLTCRRFSTSNRRYHKLYSKEEPPFPPVFCKNGARNRSCNVGLVFVDDACTELLCKTLIAHWISFRIRAEVTSYLAIELLIFKKQQQTNVERALTITCTTLKKPVWKPWNQNIPSKPLPQILPLSSKNKGRLLGKSDARGRAGGKRRRAHV